jgi:hypothetical protein
MQPKPPKKEKAKSSLKRKREDDGGRMSRKKVQTENPYIVEKVRAEYREPEDVRRSGRIAGKSANPLDPRPRGQYKRDELSPAGPDTVLV